MLFAFFLDCVDGHVHFRTDQLAAHESDILVDRQTNDILDVHLGFLQVRHVYDISFVIPCEIGPEPVFDPLENLHVKIKEIKSSDDGELKSSLICCSFCKMVVWCIHI